MYPLKLEVYETYHPGCVVRILACDRDTESDVDAGHIRYFLESYGGLQNKVLPVVTQCCFL